MSVEKGGGGGGGGLVHKSIIFIGRYAFLSNLYYQGQDMLSLLMQTIRHLLKL